LSRILFQKDWIEKETDSDMVKYTEEAGRFMANNGLTNSKIRSIYGEIKRIQMGKYNEEKAAFILLRPKVAYAHGRDNDNKGLTLFKRIFDNAANHVRDQKSFNNFCNFLKQYWHITKHSEEKTKTFKISLKNKLKSGKS
jgi:CRISPR-associated protein Csm2